MAKVAAVKTHVTEREFYDALRAAWPEASHESACVLAAQWALETGRGKSMWNYNIGNIKSFQKSGDWCFFRCNEIIKGKTVWFEPDHPACCFVAYPTLQAGVADYLSLLRRKYASAWPAVEKGDPAEFAHRLKLGKYYTASEAHYTKSISSIFREYVRKFATRDALDVTTVEGVQLALARLGFEPGKADGIAGAKTQSAVIAFQRSRALVADGVVGPITRRELIEALEEIEP
jgi:flagellum-specific peptidoglycan hydrolase FlgJ